MTTRPTAAAAIYGHLPHRTDDVAKQAQPQPSLSAALYPALAEKTEEQARQRNRQTILPDLPGTRRRS
jgi:hypothetical protein